MLRSLFSGISGLRAHQQMMDVTGNNIANVNTTGFKSSQSLFEDTLSQLMRSATGPQAGNGGTNPAQIGLGVRVAGIETNFGQGAAQNTGRSTDLMINGDGFFVLRDGATQLYTRAGSFSFDANGRLVDPHGSEVQGWSAVNGVVNTNSAPGDVQLPIGSVLAPVATTSVTVAGNLPANTTSTNPITASLTTYDAQGNPVTLTATFTYVDPTTWSATVSDGTNTSAPQAVVFAPDGSTPTPNSLTLGGVTVDLSGVTDYAGAATIAPTSQNGSPVGALQAFTIAPDGTLSGVYSNGLKQPIAQLALATFANPPGLEKAGDSDFRQTANSGIPQLGTAASSGHGTLQSGALEMSNVDLAQEFTNLVIAQRGFQANSKVITTSDELLQDLVNLKR
jgi:flagellar hook protein FlgE